MTEEDYILATEVAHLMNAGAILRRILPSDRVPKAELEMVLSAVTRWETATFAAIKVTESS